MGRDQRKKSTERRAIQEEARAKIHRQDRRNKFWIYGTGGLLIFALIATVTIANVVKQRHASQLAVAAAKPVEGVQSFKGLTRKHTSNQVNYPQNPPVGGDHSAGFINCGIYKNPVNKWEAVHSLEHGAVWVTYQPGLPQPQIEALAKEAALHPYELLSPYLGLPSPIVASAWGKQLRIQSANDPRLPLFLKKYLQGPQTPELGALCSRGIQG
jgi:hypothetical protein